MLIRGVARSNRYEKSLGLNEIEQVSNSDDQDSGARLDEFRSLKNGWRDGKVKAPSAKGLDWLADFFQHKYPNNLPLPYLYPTASAGVQAEWSVAGWEISLAIDLEQQFGEWHALKLSTEEEHSEELHLSEPAAWIWLAEQIAKLSAVLT